MNDIIDKSKLLNKNIDVKKNKQALGRGLSALLGEASKTSVEIKTSKEQNEATDKHTINKTELENKTKGSVVLIKIEHVVPNIKQPRKIFNNEKIEDLAKSIKEKGIIQPLIVRKLNESCSDYEIVAGERRFRAASFLKLKEVPCIIVDVDDSQMLEIALIENIQREDLSPIDEAEAYNELLVKHNHTHESLSHAVSKSRPYITNYLRLLSLPSSIKVMVNQKIISVGHARCLINAKNPEKLVQTVIAKKLSVRETEKLVANEAKDENGAKNTNSQPQYISSLQKDISNYLNRDVVIKQDSKGRGYIKVKFLSIEDVHRWFNIKEGK